MIDVRSEAEIHFRRRRISLRLRLRSLGQVCVSLIASAGTTESGFNVAECACRFDDILKRAYVSFARSVKLSPDKLTPR